MSIIARNSLQEFWERPGCADARDALHSWYTEAIKATWRNPQDIKGQYAGASVCGNNRVVFNVGGNEYRLVVEVQYQAGIVWVKYVGTHAQYDRIDVVPGAGSPRRGTSRSALNPAWCRGTRM